MDFIPLYEQQPAFLTLRIAAGLVSLLVDVDGFGHLKRNTMWRLDEISFKADNRALSGSHGSRHY